MLQAQREQQCGWFDAFLWSQAWDRRRRKRVAVKVLSLRGMTNWKQLELFEREAQTLASLQHPAIPRYVAHFEQDMLQDRAFFLVQVPAPSAVHKRPSLQPS